MLDSAHGIAGLTHVPADELVLVLLRHARERLDADTVAVLIVDGSGTQLLAHCSEGLEDEIRQGFRLPIGAGFAGQIAATRKSATLDEVTSGNVVNQLLLDAGITRMAGVPLLSGSRLVGVLDVGARVREPFDADDLAVLEAIGTQVATALVVEWSRNEKRAAQVLQRSLLPTRLPSVEGMEFAARYVPASGQGVGGDWYDAFTLPDGRLALVVGDVVGHGLPAAIVMGRLRSVVRAYAFEYDDPAEVLVRVARKFDHFEPGQMATMLLAQFPSSHDTITLASAGHPPPVLVAPGREPEFVRLQAAPPIGVRGGVRPVNATVAMPADATLMCFTDGLFERRTVPFDHALDQVRLAARPGPVDSAVSAVMSQMIGGHQVEDDTALVAVRRLPLSS